MEILLASEADITDLKSRKRADIRRVRLAGPLADEQLERDLNRAFLACGCAAGSAAVYVAIITCLTLGFLYGFRGDLVWWRILIYLVIASLAGKGIGLLLARVQSTRILKRLSVRARMMKL